MKILALEFSTPRRSVAVAIDGTVRGQAAEQGGRETHAFALIDRALDQAQLQRDDIECVAIGTGPGSYAGIRIAISIAQGWQLARGVKLIGVSSADAAAHQAQANGMRGRLQTVVDAQRNEFFGATYELGDQGVHCVAPFHLLSAGSGAASDLKQVRIDVLEHPTTPVLVPDAATIATLAARATNFVGGPELEPIYLRKAEFVKAPPSPWKPI